jgi:hypothetical protein
MVPCEIGCRSSSRTRHAADSTTTPSAIASNAAISTETVREASSTTCTPFAAKPVRRTRATASGRRSAQRTPSMRRSSCDEVRVTMS